MQNSVNDYNISDYIMNLKLQFESETLKMRLENKEFSNTLFVKGFLYKFDISKELQKLKKEGDIEDFKQKTLPKIDNNRKIGGIIGLREELFNGGIFESSAEVGGSELIVEWLMHIKALLTKAKSIEDIDKFVDSICGWGEIIIFDRVVGNYKLCEVICHS